MTDVPPRDLTGLKIDRDAPASGRPVWPWIALLVLAAGAGGYVLWACALPAPPTEVDTIAVPRRGAPELLQAVGYVRAQVRSDVSSKVVGIVAEINVREGDYVKAGDVIARLEARDLEANVRAVEADLELAKVDARRIEALVKSNSRSQSDLDHARAALGRKEAELAQVQAQLSYATIVAPFDGLVVRKGVERGQSTSSALGISGAIVTILDPASLQAEVDVNEAHKEKIALGMPCEVILEGLPPYRGEVAAKIPVVDRAKSTMMVRVAITTLDDKVLEGMTVRVKFLSPEAPTETPPLIVPESCVVDGAFVWLVAGGALERRTVVTGQPDTGKIRVFQGLDGGEIVVRNPPPDLKAGQKVKVR